MADFHNYELAEIAQHERGVYELADGLLPEMAAALDYGLGDNPSEEALRGFIGHIGPAKTLQDNIGRVQEVLGTEADALTLAADWTERSGLLRPVERSFASPELAVPTTVDTAVITGGVARWMLRRTAALEDYTIHGHEIGKVIIPAGNRVMGEQEHHYVKSLAEEQGRQPTEAEFAAKFIAEQLRVSGLEVTVIPVDSGNGDEVLAAGISQTEDILGGTVLVSGNAPAAAFTAGQFRLNARQADPSFDNDGDQLFMIGDTIPVARNGEGPATHQNPYTALGQIARTALMLHQNS